MSEPNDDNRILPPAAPDGPVGFYRGGANPSTSRPPADPPAGAPPPPPPAPPAPEPAPEPEPLPPAPQYQVVEATHDAATGSPLLTYREHLVELRDRLIKSIIALLITTIISFMFTDTLFELLKSRADGVHLIRTGVAEMVSTYVKVAFIAGVVLATPVWLYQIVAFVAPGLTKSERRFLFTALPGVLACFFIGVTFGYFVLLPPALQFLLGFGADIAEPLIRVGDYVSTVTGLLFWLGVIFEMPLIIYLLARLGVVTTAQLTHFRRHAIVVAFVIAAVVTPTVDPINQSLVAFPVILLYELGIILSRIAGKARAKA